VVPPTLRAGLGLVDGVLRMVPSARVGHIGMYLDEETLEPHPYFCKMPKDVAERDVMIVDPMLATGGSACEAIGEMVKRGCKHITLMVLVAAPEGIKAVQEKYPESTSTPAHSMIISTSTATSSPARRRGRPHFRHEITSMKPTYVAFIEKDLRRSVPHCLHKQTIRHSLCAKSNS